MLSCQLAASLLVLGLHLQSGTEVFSSAIVVAAAHPAGQQTTVLTPQTRWLGQSLQP